MDPCVFMTDTWAEQHVRKRAKCKAEFHTEVGRLKFKADQLQIQEAIKHP